MLNIRAKDLGNHSSRKGVKTIFFKGCKISPLIVSIYVRVE